jgi:hypothetical protein
MRIDEADHDCLLTCHLPRLQRAEWERGSFIFAILHDVQTLAVDRNCNLSLRVLDLEYFDCISTLICEADRRRVRRTQRSARTLDNELHHSRPKTAETSAIRVS